MEFPARGTDVSNIRTDCTLLDHILRPVMALRHGIYVLVVILCAFLLKGECGRSTFASTEDIFEQKAFSSKVVNTYHAAANCLQKSGKNPSLNFPDDYQEHYRMLLNKTSIFREYERKEPWIENYFIARFIDKPLEYFSGFIPLFIQWTDYDLMLKDKKTDLDIFEPVMSLLRRDVLYITFSQANQGLPFLTRRFPNVLVINAGGSGDIAVPLVKGELPFVPLPANFTPRFEISFLGSVDHGSRKDIIKEMKEVLSKSKSNVRAIFGPTKTWKDDMANTLFNLAPRGFGRASFRLAEIIQTGRIPVNIYDDYPWLAYEGTNSSLAQLGYSGKLHSLDKLVNQLLSVSHEEIRLKLDRVQKARRLYTTEGVLDELDLFFKDPFNSARSYIRCTSIPPSKASILDNQM